MSLKLRIYVFPRSLQKWAQELAEANLMKVKNAALVWGGLSSKIGTQGKAGEGPVSLLAKRQVSWEEEP